jgi:ABC-type glutathione transport system ATPase component
MTMDPVITAPPLLDVRNLVVEFGMRGPGRKPLRVLDNVSIDLRRGETVGLVGESGSGKTTLGRSILGIGPVTAGNVICDGTDITRLAPRERLRRSINIQAVFQDPYTSLNPSMSIADILTEPLIAKGDLDRAGARARVRELLDQVAMPTDAGDRYPDEFSGGQRQRIAIARALALEPTLIVCDEPVSALDLSTQGRVLDLLVEIQRRTGVAYLFVSHDLSVVRHISHRVAVLRRGRIVEFGDCDQVTSRPSHDYTRQLLLAAPVPDPRKQARRRAERQQLRAPAEHS